MAQEIKIHGFTNTDEIASLIDFLIEKHDFRETNFKIDGVNLRCSSINVFNMLLIDPIPSVIVAFLAEYKEEKK